MNPTTIDYSSIDALAGSGTDAIAHIATTAGSLMASVLGLTVLFVGYYLVKRMVKSK